MGMLDQTGKIDWRETERQLAKRFAGPLALNAPMADYTSWRVGGPAALMFWPKVTRRFVFVSLMIYPPPLSCSRSA